MAKNPDLPEELLIEIFTRLPAESVGKCRCLSKTWNSHLSTSQFINLPLNRKNQQESLIFITPTQSLNIISPPIENNAVSKKLELHNTWTRVVGSCNGLVLLVNGEKELCLINPITTQKVNIPDFHFKYQGITRLYGFGYDSCSDDYKILAVAIYHRSIVNRDVNLYSVSKGVWERVPNKYAVVCGTSSGVFVSGAIHWLNMTTRGSNPSIIAAFDLANEVFYEIPTPAANNEEYLLLSVLGERLCLVGDCDVWTMETYGSVESWTKLFSFGRLFRDVLGAVKVLCFIKSDEVVLSDDFGVDWVVYNVKEETCEELVMTYRLIIS